MSITPVTPAENSRGKVKTWVKSQWKFRPKTGQFSVQLNTIAIGRKNYLFAGSDNGGQRAASIYTLVQTAKLNGVNPESYLRDTLTKIAEGHPINKVDALLPWHTQSEN